MNATNQYQDCFINVKKNFTLSSYVCDSREDGHHRGNLMSVKEWIYSIYFGNSLNIMTN